MFRLIALFAATVAFSVLSIPTLASADEGATAYKTYCVTCHGDTGKGDGVAGSALDPKPADFSTKEFWVGKDDAYLKKVVKEGGTAVGKSPLMAAWGSVLSDAQIDAVVAHIKKWKPAE